MKGEKYLTKGFNKLLQIDYNLAEAHVNEVYQIKENNPELRDCKKVKNRIKELDILEQRNYSYIQINNIKHNNYSSSRDTSVNRFYSSMSALPGVYRNYLSYNNEELVSIDLSNSQPFLSTIFLNIDL